MFCNVKLFIESAHRCVSNDIKIGTWGEITNSYRKL